MSADETIIVASLSVTSPDSVIAADQMSDLNVVGPNRGGGAYHRPLAAILVSGTSNMIFAALATPILVDLAAIAGSRQTRALPPHRQS